MGRNYLPVPSSVSSLSHCLHSSEEYPSMSTSFLVSPSHCLHCQCNDGSCITALAVTNRIHNKVRVRVHRQSEIMVPIAIWSRFLVLNEKWEKIKGCLCLPESTGVLPCAPNIAYGDLIKCIS